MRVFISDMPFLGEAISENMSKTPEGFLVAHNVRIARIGTQVYLGAELGLTTRSHDRITAYRLEEDVFDETSLKSFEGKPITDDHPPGDMVTPDNYRTHTRGHIQNVRRDGIYIMADLVIKDASLIQKVENGKRQVSAGYWCNYDEYKDGYRQRDIVANHLSVVDKGRAGDKVLIRDHESGELLMTYTAEQVAQLLNAQAAKDVATPVASPAPNDGVIAKLLDHVLGKPAKAAKDEDGEDDEKKEKEAKDAARDARLEKIEKALDALVSKTVDEDDDDDIDEKKKAEDTAKAILASLDGDDDEDEEESKESKDAEYKAACDALKPLLVGMSTKKQQAAKDALRVKFGKKATSDRYLQLATHAEDSAVDKDSVDCKALEDLIRSKNPNYASK